MKQSIFWFRRDLRLEDNAGLYHALKSGESIQCIFIFDTLILDDLKDKSDPRVSFIYQTISELKSDLESLGSTLKVFYGSPENIWQNLFASDDIHAIYSNRDYEPYAISRDQKIAQIAEENSASFHQYKDHIIFEKEEVTKGDGGFYTVFTPYKRKWLAKLDTRVESGLSYYFKSYPTLKYKHNLIQRTPEPLLSLSDMGFELTSVALPSKEVKQSIIKKYDEQRNFPAINGTSRLGIHFRFGTISIREKARKALDLNETYLSELVWRDFYSQILSAFPHVSKAAFRSKYDRVEWRYDDEDIDKWKNGMTGYPMVDAGMRELNSTGHMHNRVRMIVASFLTKHLLIHWTVGEAYFAEKLLDYDLASNNGGWQWASGSGTDAAPYFRIFNPASQLKKFDKDMEYVKKWVPEVLTNTYPQPMVDHKFARERCLAAYKAALNTN